MYVTNCAYCERQLCKNAKSTQDVTIIGVAKRGTESRRVVAAYISGEIGGGT